MSQQVGKDCMGGSSPKMKKSVIQKVTIQNLIHMLQIYMADKMNLSGVYDLGSV